MVLSDEQVTHVNCRRREGDVVDREYIYKDIDHLSFIIMSINRTSIPHAHPE